jgi:hypothetical protein
MARALTGLRMQCRLITTLGSGPGVWTNDQLCKALRLHTVDELRQVADSTRRSASSTAAPLRATCGASATR